MKPSIQSAHGWNLLKMQDTTQIGLSYMNLIKVLSGANMKFNRYRNL